MLTFFCFDSKGKEQAKIAIYACPSQNIFLTLFATVDHVRLPIIISQYIGKILK